MCRCSFIRTTIDTKTSKQVLFIDLQKAFDKLDHEILVNKVKKYGFWWTVLNSLREYLSDRWQFVSINDKSTSLRKIGTGIPQGSVVEPLFFLLYIKDLELAMQECEITIIEDDIIMGSHCVVSLYKLILKTQGNGSTQTDSLLTLLNVKWFPLEEENILLYAWTQQALNTKTPANTSVFIQMDVWILLTLLKMFWNFEEVEEMLFTHRQNLKSL